MASTPTADQAIRSLFGTNLVRAEIVNYAGGEVIDHRVNRGVVKRVRPRFLILGERDGRTVRIAISPRTRIAIDGKLVGVARIRKGMQATTLQLGNARASWVSITKKRADRPLPKIRSLLSGRLIRTEVVSFAGGVVRDSRADIGVIQAVDVQSLTLSEPDGTVVEMRLETSTQVEINNKQASASELAAGMRATTLRHEDGPVSRIWAAGKKQNPGKGRNKQ